MKHLFVLGLLVGNILGQSAFAGFTDFTTFCTKENVSRLLQTDGDLITIDDLGKIAVNKHQNGVVRSKIHNDIIEIKSSYMITYLQPGFGGASDEITINVYRSVDQKLARIERIVPVGEKKNSYEETAAGPHRVEGILCDQRFSYVQRFATAPTPQDLQNALHQAYHNNLHQSEGKAKLKQPKQTKQNSAVDRLRKKLPKKLSYRADRVHLAERIESSDLVRHSSGNVGSQPASSSESVENAN